MRVKIIESGETTPEILDQTIIETFNPQNNTSKIHRIPLRTLFNFLAENKSREHIKRDYPENTYPETIKSVQNFLIARMPGLYADNIGGWPDSKHRFLIDENLSKNIGISLWKDFGRSTHINFESMQGHKDPEVWKWARKNRISAIITRDKHMTYTKEDLGLIAVKNTHDIIKRRKRHGENPTKMSRLPLLIMIDSGTGKSATSLMKTHKQSIMQQLNTRTTPYILLTAQQCIFGPSYNDIAQHDWETTKNIAASTIKNARQQTYPNASPSSDQALTNHQHHGYSK